jgi:WD40 repeat protein
LPNGTLIYPVGNNLLLEKDKDVSFLKGHDNEITAVAVSNAGTFIVTGQLGSNHSKNYESPLFVWDIKSKQLIKQLPGLKDGIRSIVISKDDSLIAAASIIVIYRRFKKSANGVEHQNNEYGAFQTLRI